MLPVDFPEKNTVFTKPQGWTDEQCGDVSAFRGIAQDGTPYINTVWMPSKEDLDALNSGRPLILTIISPVMIPVSMFTCDFDGKPNT